MTDMQSIYNFTTTLCILHSIQTRQSPTKRGNKKEKIERPGLSEEEIEEIREAFNLFDTDGSG